MTHRHRAMCHGPGRGSETIASIGDSSLLPVRARDRLRRLGGRGDLRTEAENDAATKRETARQETTKQERKRGAFMANRIRHIAIIVPDAEEAAKFYEQALGFRRAGTARRGIYLSD